MKKEAEKIVTFSAEFKREKVQLIVDKKYTVLQISRLYKVTPSAVYKWIGKYSDLPKNERMVVQKQSEGHKTMELQEKVASLEQYIGQQQLRIDYLEKVLSFGSGRVQFDIEKKFKQR